MSRHHSWLRFTSGGPALPLGLDADPVAWQAALDDLHRRWYDGVAPPQVSAVFVLQWLLQVPAHTAAHAAVAGPWRARLDDLTFRLGGALVPEVVRLTALATDEGDVHDRMAAAEADYRDVAEPLALGYGTSVRLGPHVRSSLVTDMWVAASREALAVTGHGLAPVVAPRESCCLIYALPGCTECAGCPRLR